MDIKDIDITPAGGTHFFTADAIDAPAAHRDGAPSNGAGGPRQHYRDAPTRTASA